MRHSKSAVYFPDQTPVLRLLFPLVTGIVFYDHFPGGQPALIPAASLIFLAMVLGLTRIKRHKQWRTWCFCCIQLFFVLTGYLVYALSDTGIDPAMLNGSYTHTIVVTDGIPVQGKHNIRLPLRIIGNIRQRQVVQSGGGCALLYLRQDSAALSYRQGDTLLLPAKWQPVSNSGNPFEFDYSAYCRRKNIRYTQYAGQDDIVRIGPSSGKGSILQRCHRYCISSIQRYIKDTTAAALLQAIITGDESELDPETRQAYADTGIIHIVSVSGAHVNLLFIFIAFLLGFIRQRRWQWIQFVLSGILVWFYVLMAGAAAPAIRAALMFTLVATGTLWQRQVHPLNQWCSAAFLMLLYKPAWLFAAGFQLSFLALLSLLLFYKPIRDLLRPGNRLLKWLWEGIALSLAAEILVAPLVIYYFHSFPFTFLAANLIAGLVMSALLLLGVLLVLLAAMPLAAAVPAAVLTYISTVFHHCIFLLQSFSPVFLKELQLDAGNLLLLYIFIISLAVFLISKQRLSLWLGLSTLSVFGFSTLYLNWSCARQRRLIVYNARHFQAELLEGISYKTLAAEANSFVSGNAHLGYRCTHDSGRTELRFLLIAGKRILVQDRETADTCAFPADIVVLKPSGTAIDMKRVFRCHHPELVVIGAGMSQRQLRIIQEQCDALQVRVHNTRLRGAFVFPSR